MEDFDLDFVNTKEILLSNDAFFWLKDNEPMLDEANMEEANKILAMFHNGFVILDETWSYEGNNTIKAEFVPYASDEAQDFDGCIEPFVTNYDKLYYKILSKNECFIKIVNTKSQTKITEGNCKLEYIYNRPWIITPKGSRIPIK